jgi:hypothetical protein
MHRFACSIALCGTALGLGLQQNVAVPEREREADVYKIYSLLMTNPGTSHGPDNNPRYLIAGTTRPDAGQKPCVEAPPERRAEFREVLEDFESRKTAARTLKRELSIAKPYELLDAAQTKAFQEERLWPRPVARQPDARFHGVSDLFFLSEVYFSKKRRLALTSVASWCGGLCGRHRWAVLEKLATGEWEERPWVSCFTIASL